jgi:tetratricopeptide (TPR) repeat protein
MALSLRAEALKIAGRQDAPFAGVEQLPPEVLQVITNHVVGRKDESDPAILSRVLQELLPELRKRFAADDEPVVNSLIWIANFEIMRGKQGDLSVRLWAASELAALQDQVGRLRDALQAVQGLALALGDAGRSDEAVTEYRGATERAKKIADPALLSQVRRNFGLLLSDLNRDHEAEEELIGAVEAARNSSDAEMLSRARIALGIFYQHRRRLTEASPLLVNALQNTDLTHADAVIARSHLQALQSGKTCGCDHQAESLAAAAREFVRRRLPDDLLANLEARLEDNDFRIEVELARKPEREELDRLNRVIMHALTEFRQRATRRQ